VGTPVATDALIEELWAGEPPDGAATTLRSYVSRLRAALGSAAPIEHVSAGYVLEVPADWIDITRFDSRVREGAELLGRGRHRRAAEVLRSALTLWRGRPFEGIVDGGAFGAEAVRLEGLRMHALQARIEADLELGHSTELVVELEHLIAEDPFQERLWRQLMLALYRAGRQKDALAAYHRARKVLDEQLGIEPSEDLRQLEAAILRQEVPPTFVHRAGPTGLPVPLTTFIGRTREVEEVIDLVRRVRLVTLVGVGGVGKTRLALEAARRALDELADEVAFVDLATVSDPALVQSLVAASLGVAELPGQDLVAALRDRLGAADVLLVLDNGEHLRAAAAELAQTLLAGSPGLRILATSREVLDVAGEAAYPVTPLAIPGPADDIATVRQSDAVRLLMDRALLTRHELRIDDAAYETAARICRELDGLPLAIELAAARTKALSLDEIAERLRDRFRFLVSWRRLSAARHRTLREAMDWSHELLAADEQRLLARLSVFPAGATLASIAEVCLGGDGDEAERLLERLADASLIVPTDHALGTRYRLLETVRQYAAERLPASELADLSRRHAERARTIARSTNLAVERTGAYSFELAHVELPSIRAAIQWASDADPPLGLEIACALERFWVINHPREGVALFSALLASGDIPDQLRARGLRCRGGCHYYLGDFTAGVADYDAALAIHRRSGDAAYEAHLVQRLAIEAHRRHDLDRARELFAHATAIGGEDRFPADEYIGLGLLADIAFAEDRVSDGFDLIHRALDLAAAAGDDWWEIDAQLTVAERALDLGRLDDAGPAARAALRLAVRIVDRQSAVWALALLAREAAARGLGHRAGRIWGGLEAEVVRGAPLGQWDLDHPSLRDQVAALAGEHFPTGVAEGATMTLDEVVEEALRAG
jgi:predicted ATPase/DNA-binding SARP family transcriptional activator